MIRIEINETINRPIEEVFDRLVDIDGYSDWMPRKDLLIRSRQDAPGAVGVGTPYTDETWMGKAGGEVVAFDRPTSIGFEYTIRYFGWLAGGGRLTHVLESAGEGRTHVHHTGEAYLRGPFKLMQPLMQRVANGERGRTIRALKRSFENTEVRRR